MKEELKKKVALVSEDKPTAKLIDIVLSGDAFTVDVMSSETFYGKVEEKTLLPSLIIYDHSGAFQGGEKTLCLALKRFPRFDETPRLVISTFVMECSSCPEYTEGRCGHVQKPFRLDEVKETVAELTKKT